MAGRVSVECPGCQAKLNLSDSSKLGKKIKCPKCSDVFVAKAVDEDEDLEDEDEDQAPAKSKGRQKPAAAAGKKGAVKKGGSSGGGSNTPLIAGGAVLVLALIGGGLYFAGVFGGGNPQPAAAPPPMQAMPTAPMAHAPPAPPPKPAENPAERILSLRWMPAGTELLLHAKVSDLWQAALLKGLVDTPQAAMGIAELKKATGLTPTDIESVTVGMADLQEMQGPAMSVMMGFPAQKLQPKVLGVVRTKKNLLLDEILKASQEIKSANHNSKPYFENVKGEPFGGWLADSTTLVMGPLAELHAAMDRGQTVTPRKELMFMDPSSHVLLVVAPKETKSLSGGMPMPPPPPGTPPEVTAMQKALIESFAGFSLGVNVRGGVDLQTSVMLSNADSAGKVKDGLTAAIAEGRKQFESYKSTGLPLLAELGDLLLNNLKVESTGQVVKASTNVPDSEQQKLEQLPVVLTMMAMTGGLGGGKSPFGLGIPGLGPEMPDMPTARFPGEPSAGGESKGSAETEPVDAAAADGIPAGTTLTARTAWTLNPSGRDEKSSYWIKLNLDLTGDELESICGCGQLNFKSVLATGGEALKIAKPRGAVHADPTKVIEPFSVDEPVNHRHPEGTMRVSQTFHAPKEEATSIESFEGTFVYLTSKDSQEVTIDDAVKAAKRPLTNPGLKGVKLILATHEELGNSLTLLCGKDLFLGRASAIYPDQLDHPVEFETAFDKNQSVQRIYNQNLPEKLRLRLKVYRDVKEHTVSFKFKNVPLPSADSKPQATEPDVAAPPAGGSQQPGGPRPPNGFQPPNAFAPPGGQQPPIAPPQPPAAQKP